MEKQSPPNFDISARYQQTLSRIAKAAQTCGRQPQEVQLLAASKAQPAEKILELFRLGQRSFGENYAQELASKATALKHHRIDWHFIGHIQSNKIKLLAEHSHCVQSIDQLRHARSLWDQLNERGRLPFPIYIAVNAGDELQKTGVSIESSQQFAQDIEKACPGLEIQGIMAVPPAELNDTSDQARLLYNRLRQTADQIGQRKLSLGMSGDLETAIAAGSTMVRIGTALLGERIQKAGP